MVGTDLGSVVAAGSIPESAFVGWLGPIQGLSRDQVSRGWRQPTWL